MKGQSAIEYLMTYGWMLLVVAIVGGAIFATVNGRCVADVSGFTGSDIMVEDIGIQKPEDDVIVEVRNTAPDPVRIDGYSIQMEQVDADTGAAQNYGGKTIPVGDTRTFRINMFADTTTSTSCNRFSIELGYDIKGGLQDLKATGKASLKAKIPEN
jgi:hypothetical protein